MFKFMILMLLLLPLSFGAHAQMQQSPPDGTSHVPPHLQPKPNVTMQELLDQAKKANPGRFEFAQKKGAKIIPTRDGRSFLIVWYPDSQRPHSDVPLIVTFNGHGSYAFDEFFLWHDMAEKFGFADKALFHTLVTSVRWNEDDKRWHVATNRGDTIRARFVVMAAGVLNMPKLPGIRGIGDFKGKTCCQIHCSDRASEEICKS